MNSSTLSSTSTRNLPEALEYPAIQEELRRHLPSGHPKFLPILLSLAKLHNDKNHDYASGGNALGNFERVGKIKALYPKIDWSQPEAVAVSYMLKQFDAALWGMNSQIKTKIEGAKSRWTDVAIYAMIILCMLEEKNQ